MAKHKSRFNPSHTQLGLGSLALAIISWAGFLYYTYQLPPASSTYPAFFAILGLASACTALPIILIIDRRWPTRGARRRSLWRPTRMGAWVGLWVAVCAGLQFVQLLNPGTAVLFLGIFALIEWFIISRK